MKNYNHKNIEQKWQSVWEQERVYKTSNKSGKSTQYILDMFPYPSGEGLHVGHPKGYIATDVYSRFKRMNGYNVLHPMGWDAFGLPAENYAIKNKIHPREAVDKNVTHFRNQLKQIGLDYDWSREINTTNPAYYKWTQWAFLQMYKKGLAYQSYEPINWCPSCKTGLANEDLEQRDTKTGSIAVCERCGTEVEQKPMRQWVLRITEYADSLLNDLEGLNWPESVKESQRNWIGRSEGACINFPVHTKTRFVLLHGYKSSPNKHFFPWLQKELEGRGYSVEVPELPHPDSPTIEEQVQYVLDTCHIDEHTVLVGHSLGGVVALRVIERLQHSIKKLVTIATPIEPTKKDRPYVASFPERFDFDYIRNKTNSIQIIKDETDTVVPSQHCDRLAQATGGTLYSFTAQGCHFTSSQEPALVNVLSEQIEVFTTRPDTIHGATYIVLAPEHPRIDEFMPEVKNQKDVIEYRSQVKNKTEMERITGEKDKTGVKLEGISVINPANKEKIPVYISDYVMTSYGTGAIMAVPAHDKRDWIFAKKFGLPIKQVIVTNDTTNVVNEVQPYTGYGVLTQSGDLNGLHSVHDQDTIIASINAEKQVTYKLKDWVFSRQRYWGEPIPLIHCDTCGVVPVPEADLPVELPDVEKYEPSGTGESPLAMIDEWVNTTCPDCGGDAKRETNTMPQWAGSCWYYLRYIDPINDNTLVDSKKEKQWMPVDMYVGGMEHATRHLIYARFWHKFLYDLGLVSSKEPFTELRNPGLIIGPDGQKMSKSKGNTISPDDIVEQNGADTFRTYEMFMGPFEQMGTWNINNLVGARRFLERVWKLRERVIARDTISATIEKELHKTVKKVTEDISTFQFNTAISQLMIFTNVLEKEATISQSVYTVLLQLLAPIAPHITEELWRNVLHNDTSIHVSDWPEHDPRMCIEDTMTIAVQVNGKVRDEIVVNQNEQEKDIIARAKQSTDIKKWITGKTIKRTVYVPHKLVNIVIE